MKRKTPLKILGVMGNPVSHSLSPLMHNAALAALKIPYLYMPFLVETNELPSFFDDIKNKNIVGLNVTIPHKQNVIPFMQKLTKQAELIGAVNTICVRGSGLTGHNTDADGYVTSLKKQANFNIKNKRIILLGSGGAARAIAVGLCLNQAQEILILNRTQTKADELCKELALKFKKTKLSAESLNFCDKDFFKKTHLFINSTSLGMKNQPFPKIKLSHLHKNTLVSDIVYTPLHTPLLKKALKLGLKTHPGWGMLLFQGVLSLEKWTHQKIPVDVMKKTLLSALYN